MADACQDMVKYWLDYNIGLVCVIVHMLKQPAKSIDCVIVHMLKQPVISVDCVIVHMLKQLLLV